MFDNKKNKVYQTLVKQIQDLERESVVLKNIVNQDREVLVYFLKQLQIIFHYLSALSTAINNNLPKNKKIIYINKKDFLNSQKMNEYIETLRKIESELEKYKDDIIPGSMGES